MFQISAPVLSTWQIKQNIISLLYEDINNIYVIQLLWESNKLISTKLLEPCFAQCVSLLGQP